MKAILSILIVLALCSCADTGVTTKVYNANGSLAMQTGANAATLDYHSADGTALRMTGVDHATPMLANGTGTALVIDATGKVIGVIGAGVVGGLLAIPHPATAAATATIPAAASQIQGVVHPPVQIVNQWVSAHGTPSPSPHHKVHHRHHPNASPPKDE